MNSREMKASVLSNDAPIPSADTSAGHLLKFRETLHSNWNAAVAQTESGQFYAKRLQKLVKHIGEAEENYAQSIIKAVNSDSEKLQNRLGGEGADGCPQFWSSYLQLQQGLLDLAAAHAQFAMKLHAHVMEPLLQHCAESEQAMSMVLDTQKVVMQELQTLDQAEVESRGVAVHALTSLRHSRDHEGDGDHESAVTTSSAPAVDNTEDSGFSFWSITKAVKNSVRDAVSSVQEKAAEATGKSKEFNEKKLQQRFERVKQKTEKAQEACRAYKSAIDKSNHRREKYYTVELPGLLDQLQVLEERRLVVSQQRLVSFAESLDSLSPLQTDVATKISARAAAIKPRQDLDHFLRSLGYLSGSTPSAQNSTYNVPADLQELEAEVMSANSLAGVRRKVYGSKKDTFTIDSLVMMEMDKYPNATIPRAIVKLTEAIRPHLNDEGIFRISASTNELDQLRTHVLNGNYSMQTGDSYALAALLKELLRNEPIFPASMYKECIDLAHRGESAATSSYDALIQRLPAVNQRVLMHVLTLISEAAEPVHSAISKMTLPNLAIVFCPGFLRNPSDDPAQMMMNNKLENGFVIELVNRMKVAGRLAYVSE